MKAQATNGRAAGKIIRCMLAALLVAAAVFAGLPSRSQAAYAADGSLSDATWEEVKGGIEDLMGTPYVWGGKGTSGWDCSGFVGWVIANVYGLSWPGGSPGNCGTDAIAAFCAAHETFRGSSADDYNAAFAAGTVKPGDVIVFSNASGATVHCAIAGEGATVYHAWSEHFGTCNVRFDYMWGIDGGHGKTYASFAVYRGLSEGGFVTLDKTSADASVTAGNGEYTLAGAVYGVYQGGSLVAQFTTDESSHGQTSEKLPNGDYVVREISAPAGYALSQEEFHVTVAGGNVHVNAQDAPVTVNLTLIKKDAETLLPEPQGAASLDGAEYEATYLHGGEYVTAKGVVENSKLAFEGIPLGTVTIKETKAPAGYLPDPEAHEITVTADMAGSESPVFEHEVADELTEQVIRGDLKLVKVGEGDQGRMAGVPFLVTSATTGESHTIVTDANGCASTAASWNPHTADTNGGTAESGVWFGGGEPDDALGALPYDAYIVEEQPCEANADRELIPAFEVSVRYEDGAPKWVEKVVVSTQHAEEAPYERLRADVVEQVVRPVLAGEGVALSPDAEIHVNPTGRFVIGGPMGDCGLTGRKVIVDTYGGMGRHGGGAFSGKDCTKVDRSAAYAARWVAKNVVAAGLAARCEVQVAYAIGVARPVSLMVETFGTEKAAVGAIERAVAEVFDLRPGAIIDALDLRRPIYRKTAAYGHFGRELPEFTWERTDRAEDLRKTCRLA